MADLKVLQLINDNTAVALNYGVFRRKDINATAQVVLARKVGGLGQTGWCIIQKERSLSQFQDEAFVDLLIMCHQDSVDS